MRDRPKFGASQPVDNFVHNLNRGGLYLICCQEIENKWLMIFLIIFINHIDTDKKSDPFDLSMHL